MEPALADELGSAPRSRADRTSRRARGREPSRRAGADPARAPRGCRAPRRGATVAIVVRPVEAHMLQPSSRQVTSSSRKLLAAAPMPHQPSFLPVARLSSCAADQHSSWRARVKISWTADVTEVKIKKKSAGAVKLRFVALPDARARRLRKNSSSRAVAAGRYRPRNAAGPTLWSIGSCASASGVAGQNTGGGPRPAPRDAVIRQFLEARGSVTLREQIPGFGKAAR